MQTVFVGGRIYSHSFYAHLPAGTDDPQCNFATICNKYFLEHKIINVIKCGKCESVETLKTYHDKHAFVTFSN